MVQNELRFGASVDQSGRVGEALGGRFDVEAQPQFAEHANVRYKVLLAAVALRFSIEVIAHALEEGRRSKSPDIFGEFFGTGTATEHRSSHTILGPLAQTEYPPGLAWLL